MPTESVRKEIERLWRCCCPLLPLEFCSAPVFSGIVVDVEPSGYISFKMFAEKFQQKKIHTLSTVEEPGNKGSAFHEIVPRFRCQSGNFTCCNDNISKSIHREKLKMSTSSWSIWVLVFCSGHVEFQVSLPSQDGMVGWQACVYWEG